MDTTSLTLGTLFPTLKCVHGQCKWITELHHAPHALPLTGHDTGGVRGPASPIPNRTRDRASTQGSESITVLSRSWCACGVGREQRELDGRRWDYSWCRSETARPQSGQYTAIELEMLTLWLSLTQGKHGTRSTRPRNSTRRHGHDEVGGFGGMVTRQRNGCTQFCGRSRWVVGRELKLATCYNIHSVFWIELEAERKLHSVAGLQ